MADVPAGSVGSYLLSPVNLRSIKRLIFPRAGRDACRAAKLINYHPVINLRWNALSSNDTPGYLFRCPRGKYTSNDAKNYGVNGYPMKREKSPVNPSLTGRTVASNFENILFHTLLSSRSFIFSLRRYTCDSAWKIQFWKILSRSTRLREYTCRRICSSLQNWQL